MAEIAAVMDDVEPPASLAQLAAIHRWPGGRRPRSVSLRELCRRHEEPARTRRLLVQNTWLLPGVDLRTWCQGPAGRYLIDTHLTRIGAKPDRERRARELGARIVSDGYDWVALCEAFGVNADWVIEGIGTPGPGVSRGPAASSTRVGIGHHEAAALASILPQTHPLAAALLTLGPVSCPPFTERRVGAPTLDSGLATLSRDPTDLAGAASHAYDNKGEPLRDIDFWSAKGVQLSVLDIGVGRVEIYNTHLYAGGHLAVDPTPLERTEVKRAQVGEVVAFVREQHDPANVAIVVGDFNIDGLDPTDPAYVELSAALGDLGMDDLWRQRSVTAGVVTPGPTALMDDEDELTWRGAEVCDLGADGRCAESAGPVPTDDPPERIDYIFVERQRPEHAFLLDLTRPRRVSFTRAPGEEVARLSDHAGLATTLIASTLPD